MNRILIGSLLTLIGALPAAGQGIGLPLLGGGNSLTLPIALPGGITGDVTVSFEGVTALSPGNLGVSAQLISPTDPILNARLPVNVALPSGFPVMVRIEPTPAGGLSFTGVASIQIHTLGLPGTQNNMRMAAAPLGGPFEDITTSVQRATDIKWDTSYRVLGSKGGFSEFLVVLDFTSPDQAIGAKLDRLDQILTANAGAIPEAVRADLAAELAAVRAHSLPGDEEAALQELDLFVDTVQQHSGGTEIPNVWRAARDRVNVAGLLRAAAGTLQFSLRQRQGLGQ
jgi:hypothetical protein